jgi:hypothetical protein
MVKFLKKRKPYHKVCYPFILFFALLFSSFGHGKHSTIIHRPFYQHSMRHKIDTVLYLVVPENHTVIFET